MSGEDEGLLARWSRRKRQDNSAGEREEEPREAAEARSGTTPGEETAETPAGEARADAPSAEPEMLTEADLPDIESLTYESDFSIFMKANVPLALQKRALQKLWSSNPVLANLDGLNDHDLDYTIAEMKEIAAQSAADLASGTKRLNVTDLRSKEREMRRAAAQEPRRQRPAEEAETAAATPELEAPRDAEEQAQADLAKFTAPVTHKLDS